MSQVSGDSIEAPPAADMRFAFYVSPRSRSAEQQLPLIDLCTDMTLQAEEAGFDGVFLTERHLSTHNPFQNSLQYAAYIAPQLKRMFGGLSTVIPSLWQPVRMIESGPRDPYAGLVSSGSHHEATQVR